MGLSVAAAALLLLEVGARLLLPAVPDPAAQQPQEDAMEPSAELGWMPRPGESRAFGIPGKTWINVNRTRNPEFVEPQPGELRLLTLGDSTVYGVLVNDREVFSSIAAQKLQRQLNTTVTAINGGVPGYSSEQARRLLTGSLADVPFDVLVVATQWSDSQPADSSDAWRFSRLGAASHAVLYGSGLYRLMDRLLVGPRDAEVVQWELHDEPGSRRVPLRAYRKNLHAFADIARKRGAEPVYLLLPSDRDLRSEPLEAPRPAYREAMREAAEAEGALLIDGIAPFVGGDRSLLLDDVHPSRGGHRLLGETLAAALAPMLSKQE
ncbi:MAG: lysophospholipase L1-like esterase [Myxococcota bacterium]|jgi:lysophospholipase L1-like esterase